MSDYICISIEIIGPNFRDIGLIIISVFGITNQKQEAWKAALIGNNGSIKIVSGGRP